MNRDYLKQREARRRQARKPAREKPRAAKPSPRVKLGSNGRPPLDPPARPRRPLDYSAGPPRTKLTGPPIDVATWLQPAAPPPGVVPRNAPKIKLAMDELDGCDPGVFNAWMANSYYNLAIVEGWTFLGYPYLSQLAQIPEYRLISETVATEATRKWIEIRSASEDASKADKIKELDDEMKRLGVREAFKLMSEQDGFFGRAHLYLDTGSTDDRKELMTPLGNGDRLTERKLKKGQLRALKTVEPVWCYPARYDAQDPLTDAWYNPNTWFVNGKEVHKSRLLLFVGRPVPDLLKPAFSFGGLSLSQMAKPYVDNWLQTRQSVNDLIQAFSTMVLKTDLSAMMMTGGDDLDRRIKMFNSIRNNRGVMAVSKNDEEFANVAVPLGTLDHLQAQAQEHMATPAQIPLVKLFGIQPTGLNASSDGEIRVFYDREHAYQEYFFDPNLRVVFRMAQINIWGKVDPDLTYVYKPLWELDEVALAGVQKTKAETAKTLVDGSIISPEEVRQTLVDDPDSDFNAIDVDDVPEPVDPEAGAIKERIDEDETPDDAKEAMAQ